MALDTKVSASIIGSDAVSDEDTTDTVAGLAAPTSGTLTRGLCERTVLYTATGTDPHGIEPAKGFGHKIYDALQQRQPTLSSPHPAFNPVLRDEIAGMRHAADFTVFGGQHSEGAVIVSHHEQPVDFADRIDCRGALSAVSATLPRGWDSTQMI